MRKLALTCALLVPAVGCQLPGAHTSTGWRFEVLRPPTVATAAVVSQGTGALAIAPVGAYPSAPAGPARPLTMLAAEDPCGPSGVPPLGTSRLAITQTCTLEEVCRMLARIEARLNTPPAERIAAPQPARPLP